MFQDHPSHNDSGSGPVTGSAAPDSRGDPVKIPDTSKDIKVKRRKTKRELDCAKYKSHIETFKKKNFPRGFLQRSSVVGKMGMNSRQVFITEHRLTQHQGIFNREVKSVDIGRLMKQATELDPPQTGTAPCTSVSKTPQTQGSLRLGLIPTPESKNVGHSPEVPALVSEPAPCNRQTGEEEERPPRPQSDDRANPGSGTTTTPRRNEHTPVPDATESIINTLNAHSLFPGRNLTSETRRAILEKVRNLRETKPTPSAVPEQRSQIGDVPTYRDQACQCAGQEETDIRKMVPKTQRARLPIQTPPIQFLPFSGVSPAHTLIKMVSPAEHLKEILQQPTHYGSHYSPSHLQISSHTPHNGLNINLNPDPTLSRPGRKTSSFCRLRIAGKTTCSPLNSHSPQVRWRLANEPPTDPSYTHSVPPRNIRHVLNQVTNQDGVSRTPLGDISSEALDKPRVRTKRRFSLDRASSDVFWGGRDQRPITTRIPDTSPATIRSSYREQSPASSNCSVFLQTPIPGAHGFLSVFPLDSFEEPGRETKRAMSSWREADPGQHCGRFAANTMPRQRHQSQRHNLCLLREEPGLHSENDGGRAWIHSKDWPHGRPRGEQRKPPAAASPPSVQQEFCFTPFPCEKTSKNELRSRSSPMTWAYPRMKLY